MFTVQCPAMPRVSNTASYQQLQTLTAAHKSSILGGFKTASGMCLFLSGASLTTLDVTSQTVLQPPSIHVHRTARLCVIPDPRMKVFLRDKGSKSKDQYLP